MPSGKDSEYEITFEGTLFLPCSLFLPLVFVLEESEGVDEIKNVEWLDEEEMISKVEKLSFDGRKNEETVFGCVIYNGKGTDGKQTQRYVLRNKIEEKKEECDDNDNLSQLSQVDQGGGILEWIAVK
jgi:hypothetical protein